jgi:hypothetical protein
MGAVVLGYDHAAGGFFVQAVDDAGAQFTADAAEVVAVMQESVDKGTVWIPCGGVDDQPRGFVEHEDVCVFIHDVQRYVLGLDGHVFRRWDDEGDAVTGSQFGAGLAGVVVDLGVGTFDEVLEACAGEVWDFALQKAVQAGACAVCWSDFKFHLG